MNDWLLRKGEFREQNQRQVGRAPLLQNILLRFSENYDLPKSISRQVRGALRPIVTKRGPRDAMDAKVLRARFFARTKGTFRTAKSCGPGAPGLALSLR
jgi:hypothetical protein